MISNLKQIEYTQNGHYSASDRWLNSSVARDRRDRRRQDRREQGNRQSSQLFTPVMTPVLLTEPSTKKPLKDKKTASNSRDNSDKNHLKAYQQTLETHLDWQYPVNQMIRSI